MNGMKNYLLFIAGGLILTTFSCKEKKSGHINTGETVVVKLDSLSNQYSLVDFIQNLKIVNLETNEKSLISEAWGIQRILFIDNKYFVFDGKYMGIKVFDINGKYLYDIGKLGMGSGEFIRIEDLEYYSPHNSLMVLCNNPTKISEFSLDGKLIEDVRMDYWATHVAFENNNSRIFYVNQNKSETSGDKNVLFADSMNEVHSAMFDSPPALTSVIKFSGGLFPEDGRIYFSPAFSNTYYTIDHDTATPAFRIEYGKKNIPDSFHFSDIMSKLDNYNFQFATFVKNKDFIGFNYRAHQVCTAFYNLQSGKVLTTENKGDSLNSLFSNLVFNRGDAFIIVLDKNAKANFIRANADLINSRFPGFDKEINLEKPNSNPALLVFTLKS